MDKTTITEVAAGTALVCGSIDNAINSRRIKRLEKEAIKQRKKTIAAATIGGTSLTSSFVLWVRTKKAMKKTVTANEEKIASINAKIDVLRAETEKNEKSIMENMKTMKEKYDISDRLSLLEAKYSSTAVAVTEQGKAITGINADFHRLFDGFRQNGQNGNK